MKPLIFLFFLMLSTVALAQNQLTPEQQQRREQRALVEQERLENWREIKFTAAKQASAARKWRLANRIYIHPAETASKNISYLQGMIINYSYIRFFNSMPSYNYNYGYRHNYGYGHNYGNRHPDYSY